ncbi:hypothetical protein Tco_0764766 [Tanacetum coccineum]
MMMVVPMEEVYVEALQVKYLIIDWEIYSREYPYTFCEVVRDLDEVSDDDVSSESAALRRAALRVGVNTGRNPNILFLTVVRIRLRTVGEAIMTGVDMQAGDAVAISVDGIVVSGDDDPDGKDGRNLTLSLYLDTMSSLSLSDTCLSSSIISLKPKPTSKTR